MIQGDPGARLSVTISNGMTVEVRLGQKEVKIGRGREADLQLPDPSVSRLHAKVFRVGHQYFLADLRSRNGTHADGKRITQLALEDGRMFQVGPFRIHFHRPASGASAGEEPTVPPGSASVLANSVGAEPVRVPKRSPPMRRSA
jgi:pSer/pThr/pTyr-binding forkhead associated (FHA) protein